jgi:dTDP-glucose 4,6-dehydratase
MSKTVLITGAAGFLGSHLCDRFIAEEFHVIGMDNYITGDQDNIHHLFKHPNFKFIEHDVTNHIDITQTYRLYLTFCFSCQPY